MTWTTATLGRADHIDQIVEKALAEGKTHQNITAKDLRHGDILFPAGFTVTNPCGSTNGCCGDERIVLGFCPGQVSHRLRMSAHEPLTVLR